MSCFYRIFTIWIYDIFPREESKSILSYQCMIDDCSCSSSAKQVELIKCLSHRLLFAIDSSNGFESSFTRSKKLCPLSSNTWKVILQNLRMFLHSVFLLKFHDNLQEKIDDKLNFPAFLSTKL